MNIIYLLAILAIILAGLFLIAFLFALHNGQFDDSQTPSHRILMDDNDTQNPKTSQKEK